MSRHRIMVDIEGLGTMPGGVVLSIGWCRFNLEHGPNPFEACEVRLEIQPQLDAGLTVAGDTLDWWLHQTALPWAPTTPIEHPHTALERFAADMHRATEIWAKPPQYDLTGIRAACAAFGITQPWHFRKERCFRTLKAISPKELHVPPLEEGTKHGAVVDAIHQAREAAAMLKAMSR